MEDGVVSQTWIALKSRGITEVVVEHASEPLAPSNRSATALFEKRLDEPATEALMRPFLMMVGEVLTQQVLEVRLAERDDVGEAVVSHTVIALCFQANQAASRW